MILFLMSTLKSKKRDSFQVPQKSSSILDREADIDLTMEKLHRHKSIGFLAILLRLVNYGQNTSLAHIEGGRRR